MKTKKKMRAAAIVAPGEVAMREVEVPEPGSRQVRVRLEGCGVCASNLGPWHGLPWIGYPMGPGDAGHEGWGVVDAVGEDVDEVAPGQRVAALSFAAYAEYDLADADAVVPLPPALDDVPFPGEPLACAVNIFERTGVQPGQVVAVVGIGFLGAVLTRLATLAGAEVIAISRRESSLELARRMGAAHTLAMRDHEEIIGEVRRLTEDRLCERVIEAVGLQWPLDLAAELTGTRGRLVVAGYHQDGPRQVNMQLWNWRGLDVVNAHERDPARYVAGLRRAVALTLDGTLDLRELVTHTWALEDLAEALDATAAKPAGFVKAVVIP